MARTIRRLRRSSRRRVRRNPPKMTPALKRKIGARIRALHRAGKYKRSRPAGTRRRRSRRSLSVSRAPMIIRRSSRRRSSGRRVSRRRRSFRRTGGRILGSLGGGLFGLRAVFAQDNIKMVGGAVAGTFIANYGCALICPRLGSMGTNPFVQAAVKLGTTALAAKLANRYSRPVAQGILLGGMLVVANDVIRMWMNKGAIAASTSQYLGGRGMSQYLGAAGGRPTVNRDIRSLVGPVTPTAKTFGGASRGMGALYGNTSAFKSDAWSR